MTIEDYSEAFELWQSLEGIGISDGDSAEEIHFFLKRNPSLCYIVRDQMQLIGTVLCGHDGRRGYLHHLAVHPSYQGKGIARAMVKRVLEELKAIGIPKCHAFVFETNTVAIKAWNHLGWRDRTEMKMFSCITTKSEK